MYLFSFLQYPLSFATALLHAAGCVWPYLRSHVGVRDDHVEVIVGHAKVLPQLCDQILVHQILLAKALHRLVILWRRGDQRRREGVRDRETEEE